MLSFDFSASYLVTPATAELKDFLSRTRGGDIRVVKIVIRNGKGRWSEGLLGRVLTRWADSSGRVLLSAEELVLDWYREPEQSWDKDYDAFLLPLLTPQEPCYILYRLDSKNAQGYEWIFLAWSPEQSPV